jgi:ParB family transcriptional regulator, chromosome partitioning protein
MSSDMYRDSIFWVEVERIKPNPFQPRREFDQGKLQELSESIRMYGLLQPLTVTRNEIPREDGGLMVEYELIAGERRLRASKLAGLAQVPVIIRVGEETDQMKLELAIIENLQREDLNPVDRAKAFEKLYREFKFTHNEIGKKVGKSREYVSNTLRLLLLPEFLLTHLAEGKITEGHTRPLLMLNDKPEEQNVLAREIVLKKLTVRESEALARRVAQDKVSAKHKINPEILALERALTEKLGTRVTIEPREVGGRVVISFFSANDLQVLLDTIRMESESTSVGDVFNGIPAIVPVVDPVQEAMQAQARAEEAVSEEPMAEISLDDLMVPEENAIDDSTLADVETFDTIMAESAIDTTQIVAETLEQGDLMSQEPHILAEVEVPAPVVAEVPEDTDLYSIRNFTI